MKPLRIRAGSRDLCFARLVCIIAARRNPAMHAPVSAPTASSSRVAPNDRK
jgi:hypothetical protein